MSQPSPAHAVVTDPQPPVLEVRIHGVSNTPPQFVLGLPDPDDVQRVVGDDSTAFYRAKDVRDQLLDTQAYSWGQLTGGIRAKKDLQRGLWMTLLPFALANVGFWARRQLPGTSTWDRSGVGGFASFVMRVFALSLTVTLSVAATGLSVDLVAWQWLHVDDPTQIRWITQLAFLREGWWSLGYRPLCAALALPFAVLLLMWVIARRSFQYEAEVAQTGAPVEPPAVVSPLESKWFWRGERQVRRLAGVHLMAGVAAACLLTIAPTVSSLFSWTVAVALVLVIAGCVGALALDAVTTRREDHDSPTWRAVWVALVVVSVYAVPATVVRLCLLPAHPLAATGGDFPAFAETVLLLFAGQFLALVGLAAGQRWTPAWTAVAAVVLAALFWLVAANTVTGLVWSSWLRFDRLPGGTGAGQLRATAWVAVPLALLCVAVWWFRRAELATAEPPGVAWRGLGGPLLMMLGWLLALLYSAGVLFFAADWLSDGRSRPDGTPPVQLPSPFQWAALGLPIAVVALVVTVAVVAVWLRREAALDLPSVLADYDATTLHARRRSDSVASKRAFHVFMQDRLLTVVGWLAVFVVAEVVLGVSAATTWDVVGSAGAWANPVRDVGVRLSLLLLLGIVALGTLVYRGDPRRRAIAIVWDLATFWPRAGHPLSPPCYAERCVPQLVTRLANDTPGRDGYVLSGHSQGAVLAVATLLQLPQDTLDRVFLLTYGTQLRYLYGRVFPCFFGPDQLTRVGGRLTGSPRRPDWLRWRSLVRLTDPLGYPVQVQVALPDGTPAWVDHPGTATLEPLPDPAAVVPPPGDIEDPPIRGHSDYNLDPMFETLTRDAAMTLRDG